MFRAIARSLGIRSDETITAKETICCKTVREGIDETAPANTTRLSEHRFAARSETFTRHRVTPVAKEARRPLTVSGVAPVTTDASQPLPKAIAGSASA